MKNLMIIAVISFLLWGNCFSQLTLEKKLSGYYNPLELITIGPGVPFDMAIQMLSSVSQKITGKTIITGVAMSDPINIEIVNLPYRTALDIIVNSRNLMYEERQNVIIIGKKDAAAQQDTLPGEDIYADITEREVNISAVFFELDVEKSREIGIDWKWLMSNGTTSLGGELSSRGRSSSSSGQNSFVEPGLEISAANNKINIGRFKGNAAATLRLFESLNMGNVIASPSVTVRNKQKGRIQVGSDFSIKQRDFSGNIIDRFYSVGSIVEVIPYIYMKNNLDYILLKLHVERSTFFPTELTTEVKKTSANTEVLLLNGEETAVGGLFINEDKTVRTGIPLLKDLPWWVFGIRYLTGSDQTVTTKKEVVILIRTELAPMLESRARTLNENKLRKELENYQNDIDRLNNSIPE